MRRFSIQSLMAFIVVSAIGLAALRNANDLWSGMMLLIALAAVGVAVMGTVILRGEERCWWAGFAFFGGGYFVLAFVPGLSDAFRPHLGTTHLLSKAHAQLSQVGPEEEDDLANLIAERMELRTQMIKVQRMARGGNDPAVAAVRRALAKIDAKIASIKSGSPWGDPSNFQRVGHALFALLAGLVGGAVAVWFYARRERAEAAAG